MLYGVVRDNFETFRAESTRLRDGDELPRFVEDEFRAFLRCGPYEDSPAARCRSGGRRDSHGPGTGAMSANWAAAQRLSVR